MRRYTYDYVMPRVAYCSLPAHKDATLYSYRRKNCFYDYIVRGKLVHHKLNFSLGLGFGDGLGLMLS